MISKLHYVDVVTVVLLIICGFVFNSPSTL